MRRTWTGTAITDVLSASYWTTRSPGTRTTDSQGIFGSSRSSPRTRMGPCRSLRRTWTGTGTPMSSPPLTRQQDRLVREPGRQGTFGPQQASPPRRMGPRQSMRRTWTGTATWMSSRLRICQRQQDRLVRERRPETFSPQQVITTQAYGALSVYAADVDGDGDTDVLSASTDDDKIAWYENLDGFGTSAPSRSSPLRRFGPGQSMRRTWTGTWIRMSLGVCRSTGRSAWAPSAPSRSSPLRRIVPTQSMRRTWTGTGYRCPLGIFSRQQDRLVREPA